MNQADIFLEQSEKKAFDLAHRKTINNNIGKYHASVNAGSAQFCDHELARKRTSFLKTQVMENLDKYLIEFETNFLKNGGKVIWARDAGEAREEILNIFKKKNARTAVKAKSMTSEEIHLNDFLEGNGIEPVETDLGEYIVQLAGQKPYHIVTPAMHMSVKDISELFAKKISIPLTNDAQELTLAVRKILREKYTSADIGISGGNFLIADIGGVAITENEGNARLSTAFPKTHIAIVGIEKLIPRMEDLSLFWPMLAHSGTGQTVTVYNTILTGPRKPTETDGPEEMYVILLDNGRSDLLADIEKRQALNCIRCGACLNICPVYKNIGGHTYGATYSGPIGSIITPHYQGMEKFKHLSYASSLCGACTTVCPVRIEIHNLLLLNRQQSVKEKLSTKSERFAFRIWKKVMKSRKLMNFGGSKLKTFMIWMLFKETWGKRRRTPDLAPRSFNQLWKDRNDKNNLNTLL
jgi:L-lactate dehydrogenase complex protein LldF